MIPISYNVRSLMVRKTTTLATAGGIALVVFVLAAALMLSAGVKKTLVAGGRDDNAIVLRKGSGNELSSSIESPTVSLVLAAPGVKKDETGAPLGTGEIVVVIAQQKLSAEPGQVSNILVRGVTENVFKVRPEVHLIAGRAPKPGTDECLVGKGIAGNFQGMSLGEKFELKKNRPVEVVGIFEAGGSSFESEVWANIETARTSFGREGLVSSVTVRLESAAKLDGFKATVSTDKQLQLETKRETTYYEEQSQGTAIVHLGHGLGRVRVLRLRRDARRDEHDVRRGRSAKARSRHVARFGLLQVRDSVVVRPRVHVPGAGRRARGSGRFALAQLRARFDDELLDLARSVVLVLPGTQPALGLTDRRRNDGDLGRLFASAQGRAHLADRSHARLSRAARLRGRCLPEFRRRRSSRPSPSCSGSTSRQRCKKRRSSNQTSYGVSSARIMNAKLCKRRGSKAGLPIPRWRSSVQRI